MVQSLDAGEIPTAIAGRDGEQNGYYTGFENRRRQEVRRSESSRLKHSDPSKRWRRSRGPVPADQFGPHVDALSRTTAAFRLSPASFARFIGDFRNAALNAS